MFDAYKGWRCNLVCFVLDFGVRVCLFWDLGFRDSSLGVDVFRDEHSKCSLVYHVQDQGSFSNDFNSQVKAIWYYSLYKPPFRLGSGEVALSCPAKRP